MPFLAIICVAWVICYVLRDNFKSGSVPYHLLGNCMFWLGFLLVGGLFSVIFVH